MTSGQDVLRAPFTVCMWVTDYCNLDCAYCYAKPFSGRRMDPKRALSLVEEFVSLGVFDMTFAGGEPTLHPAILDMIQRCVDGGVRVGLLSNGVSLSAKMIRELERITTKKNFIIQISIDSIDPEINDYVRGKTHRVLETLDRLRGSGLDVQLATVVHKKNLRVAHKVIETYYPDIRRFHFLNIQRTSSALAYPELLLDEADTLDFWLGLKEYAKRFPADLFLPSLRVQLRAMGNARVDPEASLHREATFDCGACSAGWTHVNITSDFDVLGCDIAKEHSLMGNVAEQSFTHVWRSPLADSVRKSPYPACYKIAAPDGDKLENHLKSEFLALGAGGTT
ncbi:radical SAM protein [Bradyrhizobium septentrionale]|uniref:radical SAM protein n=1 Tax=Bradyrhizobium septentrionale TaxID=1404411 RepID=UPI0030D3FA15